MNDLYEKNFFCLHDDQDEKFTFRPSRLYIVSPHISFPKMLSTVNARMQYINGLELPGHHGGLAIAVFKTFLRFHAIDDKAMIELSSAPLLKGADELWHEMIWSDTRFYTNMCEACHGGYIHHTQKKTSIAPEEAESRFIELYKAINFVQYRDPIIDSYIAGYEAGLERKRDDSDDEHENSESEDWTCG